MNKNPEISVVVTMFREGELLTESLDSVLGQSFQNFEIVLVDNNASPETRSVAEFYSKKEPDRIRIVHEPVQGMCSARNKGILESRGTYIALLDGDDLMRPDRLHRQREILISRPDLSLVTCTYDRISHDGTRILERRTESPIQESAMWRQLEQEFSKLYRSLFSSSHIRTFGLTIPSTFFFRKKTAIGAGLFDTRLNPRWCEDYEFQTRLFLQGPFYRITDSLIDYRAPSPDAQKLKEQQISEFERYWQDQRFFTILWENFSETTPKNREVLKRIRALWMRSVGGHFLGYKEGKQMGIALLRRSFRANPTDPENWKFFLKTLLPSPYLEKAFWVKKIKNAAWIREEPGFGRLFLAWPPKLPSNESRKNTHDK